MSVPSIKSFATVIAITLLFGAVSSTYAAPFTDVPSGSWYESIVQKFKDAGFLHRDGTKFRPSVAATRAEFVQLILDSLGGIRQGAPTEPSFADVQATTWFYVYMEEAGRLRWIKGDDNCYGSRPCMGRPNASINRAEASALLIRAFGFESIGIAPFFSDNNTSAWYASIIQTAADHCILQGDDSTKRVRPADTMNRAEMAAMVDRARQRLTYGLDCEQQQGVVPRLESVTPMTEQSIVLDFNTGLNPGSAVDPLRFSLTNAESILITSVKLINPKSVEIQFSTKLQSGKRYTVAVKNMLSTTGQPFADTASFTGISPVEDVDGTLDVRVSASSLKTQSLPKGAQRVPVLSIDFTASCSNPITLSSVELVREGKGNRSDISGVYALQQGERISRKRTIEAKNNTVTLFFRKPIVVQACKTITVDFAADFATTADTSGQHAFTIRSSGKIESNAKQVRGTFPVNSASFTMAAVKTGAVTVEYRSVTPKEIRVGERGKTIGRMQVSVDSVEDQRLESMLLEQDGSVKSGDLENIRIQRTDGTVLTTTVKKMEGEHIFLTFTPAFVVRQGDRITLDVLADVIGGAGRTIQVGLEESSDLLAVGAVSGKSTGSSKVFGSRVVLPTSGEPTIVAVDAGGFTVEVDGPSQQTYAPDDRNARLANVLLTAGDEPANIRKMFVLVQAQTQSSAGLGSGSGQDDDVSEVLRSVRLRNSTTGKIVSGVQLTGGNNRLSSTTKTYQIYRFDDFVVRGKQLWELQVDFVNNGQERHPKSGDKFRMFICGEPTHIRNANAALTTNTIGCDFGGVLASKTTAYQMQVEGLTTGDRIADVRPRGTIAGNFHSIANAALSIAVSSTGDSDTTVRNAKDVSLLRFEAKAGSTRDVLISRMTFDAEVGSLLNGQNYALWVDTNNDSTVDTILQSGVASQSSLVTFNKLISSHAIVRAGTSKVFEVHSSISSSPASTSLQLKFSTTTANYVEAEKVDGSTLSGIRTNSTCATAACDISVTTTTSVLWTIGQQGNLYVSKSTSPLRPRQLLGGSVSEPILKFTLRSDNEPIDVTAIRLVSSGSTASSVDKLEFYAGTATMPFASATIAGCGSMQAITSHNGISVQMFCASMKNGQLIVPAGKNTEVTVRAKMKTDTAGAVSSQRVHLWIPSSAFGNESAVQGFGTQSSTDLSYNDDDATAEGEVFIGRTSVGTNAQIVGEKNTVVLSKILSITNANPDANGTSIPTGNSDIGQFKFTSAAQANAKNGTNTVVVNKLLFSVNATNVSVNADSFFLLNKEDPNIEHSCTALDSTSTPITGNTTGVFTVSCTGMEAAAISTVLEQNSSIVLLLRSSISNVSIVNKTSTLQVSLQNFSSSLQTSFGIGASSIEWKDADAGETSTFFWIDSTETSVSSTSYRN